VRETLVGAAKRNEAIKNFIIAGKFPWLLDTAVHREALYWSWTLRTQSLSWIPDDSVSRASYCIYTTNSFWVLNNPHENAVLTEISCAPKGQTIVADASALITLHSLGLLNKTAEYFNHVLVPACYLPIVISDMRQLFPHQLSRKKSTEIIKTAVDRGTIAVLSNGSRSQRLVRLDEYQDADNLSVPQYRLRDLLNSLYTAGLLTDAQLDQANAVAHRQSLVGEKQGPLKLGDHICIAEATLMTVAGLGWLDLVTNHFVVSIEEGDLDQIVIRRRVFQALDMAQSNHKTLWDTIHSNNQFEFVAANEVLAIRDDDDHDQGIAMAGYFTAKETHLPLLVDDRVCQTLLLNDRRVSNNAAFGTDLLVQDMARVGALTFEEAADALLQLMDWRYRFIVVPPEILKVFADRHRAHPPGSAFFDRNNKVICNKVEPT